MSFVPEYILILFALITTDYFLAFAIAKKEGIERKVLLVVSLCTYLGALAFFKYFNFFSENIADFASLVHWNYSPYLLQIVLPLGLSFHVFQSLGYVIEVYKKRFSPEKNYITYALYVMFFPQLVAGPIERAQHLLPQLATVNEFNYLNARRGLERMLWGLFKKVVIADQIAQMINPFYSTVPTDTWLLIAVAFLFSFQIYADFSGYSDIAIGSAMMLGYNLTENFNRPFSSKSFAEFWRRWHISLSNWLRDYLYYPLSLSFKNVSKFKLYFSLFITFVIIGLWHGANWTYVMFGVIHGFYMVIERGTESSRKAFTELIGLRKHVRIHELMQTGIMFTLLTFSYIFFRSETVGKAWEFVSNIFIHPQFTSTGLLYSLTKTTGSIVFIVTVLMIFIVEVVQYYQAREGTHFVFDHLPKVVRYSWYYFLATSIIVFGYFGAQSFIYFQF
jgi:D-alanyl-lipoteichoic acid acyltransferase DltB (MBOAT superfamily)